MSSDESSIGSDDFIWGGAINEPRIGLASDDDDASAATASAAPSSPSHDDDVDMRLTMASTNFPTTTTVPHLSRTSSLLDAVARRFGADALLKGVGHLMSAGEAFPSVNGIRIRTATADDAKLKGANVSVLEHLAAVVPGPSSSQPIGDIFIAATKISPVAIVNDERHRSDDVQRRARPMRRPWLPRKAVPRRHACCSPSESSRRRQAHNCTSCIHRRFYELPRRAVESALLDAVRKGVRVRDLMTFLKQDPGQRSLDELLAAIRSFRACPGTSADRPVATTTTS